MKIQLNILSAMLVTVLTAAVAYAPPYQIQQGNVLDVNPQVGSAGLNYGARQYDFNAANRIVTGNVTGGASFRGVTTIRDPSSFGLSSGQQFLPSDQLSNFRRDSFNVGDLQAGRSPASGLLPYYSIQSTVTNTGAIVTGLNRPGTSQVKTPFIVPRENLRVQPTSPLISSQTATGSLLQVPTQIARIDNGRLITGPVNERLLRSPLFGAVRTVPADVLAAEAQAERGDPRQAATGGPLDTRVSRLEPLDTRINPSTDTRVNVARSPLDRVLGRDKPPAESDTRRGVPLDQQRPAPDMGAGNPRPGEPSGAPQQRMPGGPMVVHGDVFTSMRAATAQLRRPIHDAGGAGQAQADGQPANGPALARPIKPITGVTREGEQTPPPGGLTKDQLVATGGDIASTPLKTFVGTEESAVNKYMSQAEKLMRAGQYYRAADEYDLARAVDPRNPLPLVGRSMASLAAGEYMSSANGLFQAIQLFEALANFHIDMTAFVPDVAVLDRRRADLERRLEAYEDFRLRFLLGFAEYHSGLEKLGLANVKKAAAAAPPEMTSLRRFVEVLEQHAGAAKPVEITK